MNIRELRDKIQKAVKGIHVSVLSESDIADVNEWITTPAYDLNRIITGDLYKGVPQKSFTLIAGPEGSFKSSFICLCMAAAQKIGYAPVYFDSEGIKLDFFARWGINTDEMLYVYSPWVSATMQALAQIKQSNEKKYIIAIDSIGGYEREKMLTDALTSDGIKADQGRLQKDLKQMAKLLLNICRSQDSIVLSSGHFYGSPAMFAPPETLGGGKAFKYFPDIIISLKKSKMQGKDKEVTGNEISAITLKNRFFPPFNEGTIKIDYINGIDRFAGLLDLAMAAGLVERSGAWYSYNGERVQGAEGLNRLFTEKEDIFISQLNEWIKNTHYSTVNVELKETLEEPKDDSSGIAE